MHFPRLYLELCENEQRSDDAVAIVLPSGSKRLIMSANTIATDLGIRPGLTLNAAYAMVPELQVLEYDEEKQATSLQQLGYWAMMFSSHVTPCMPDILLLEVGASLKLFGGIEGIVQRLQQGVQEQSLTMQLGIAPTPAAACLLSRTAQLLDSESATRPRSANRAPGQRTAQRQSRQPQPGATAGVVRCVTDRHAIEAALANIPVEYLPLDTFIQKGLRQSGIRVCQQLFELPAAALTRRFSDTATRLLYRLLGQVPDPQPALILPEQFSQHLDLPLEAPDASALAFPINRLLGALGGFLRSRDVGIKSMQLTLLHPRHAPTRVTIAFLEATADHRHLMKVVMERLAATVIPEPATAVSLEARGLGDIARAGKDLLNQSQSQRGSIEQALDLLSARIGSEHIYTPTLCEDHRPERASHTQSEAVSSTPATWPARPLWLLPEAIPATSPLHLHGTAERIENGWWEENDVRRDYYLASDHDGSWYWVYRQRIPQQQAAGVAPEQVFIHGLFG